MSTVAKLRSLSSTHISAIVFYIATGSLLLALLPLSGFPPHLAFLGVFSLITAYSLFAKRPWAPWLVFILLVTNTVFSLYTLYSVGFSNILVALSMLGYAILTWIVSAFLLKEVI